MIRTPLLAALVGACAAADDTQPCVNDAEDPIRLGDPSSLGFSGDEVLSNLVLDHTVEVRSQDGASERALSFIFVDNGTAAVEDIGPECPDVVQGESLTIPVSFTAIGADWVTASGTGTIRAKSPDANDVWVYLTAPANPSPDLVTAAASAYDDCPSIALTFVQQAYPEAPWSAGPQGRVDAFGCSLAVPGVVEWGPVAVYQPTER